MFLAELIKSKKIDKLIRRKDERSKEAAEFLAVIKAVKSLKEETPEITLPRLLLPDIPEKEEKERVILIPKKVLYKGAVLTAAFLLSFLAYSFYSAKENSFSGLNKQAIAKEIKMIDENSPTKNIQIESRIDKIISPKKYRQDLEGLSQAQIDSEIKKINRKPKQIGEIDDLIQSYGK